MCSMIQFQILKEEILYMGKKKKKRLGVYIKMLTVVIFRWWVRWVIFIFSLILACIYPSF